MTKKKTTHYFRLEYGIALRGRIRITPDADGIWATTDANQAKILDKCMGVTRIDEADAAALRARRKKGTRSQPDDVPAAKAPRAPSSPKPSGGAPRSAQEKAAQEKAAHLAAEAAKKAETVGGELGDVLDDDEAEELDATLDDDDDDDDDEGVASGGELGDEGDTEPVTAEDIDAMTKTELRELLEDWSVEQPATSADRAKLREVAKAAMAAPTAEG